MAKVSNAQSAKSDPCDSVLTDVAQKAMDKSSRRTTEQLFNIADEMGVDPFKILLQIADGNKRELDLDEGDDKPIPVGLRALAARECLKYLCPTLKSTELTGPGGKPLEPMAVRVLFETDEMEE